MSSSERLLPFIYESLECLWLQNFSNFFLLSFIVTRMAPQDRDAKKKSLTIEEDDELTFLMAGKLGLSMPIRSQATPKWSKVGEVDGGDEPAPIDNSTPRNVQKAYEATWSSTKVKEKSPTIPSSTHRSAFLDRRSCDRSTPVRLALTTLLHRLQVKTLRWGPFLLIPSCCLSLLPWTSLF